MNYKSRKITDPLKPAFLHNASLSLLPWRHPSHIPLLLMLFNDDNSSGSLLRTLESTEENHRNFSQDGQCQNQDTNKGHSDSSLAFQRWLNPFCFWMWFRNLALELTFMNSRCFGHFASFHSAPWASPCSWQVQSSIYNGCNLSSLRE